MNKAKALVYLLVPVLILSLGINVYQLTVTSAINKSVDDLNNRLEMTSLLSQAQTDINAELEKLDSALLVSCQKLSSLGLQGSQVRLVLLELVANNSLIVNAATADVNDVLVAVEPTQYRSIEGVDIKDQEQNIQLHQTMQPAMSTMIPLVEGFPGVVMVAPIFDVNSKLVGTLSIVIQPYELLKKVIEPAVAKTAFSMWAMQTNGTLIYDPDPVQQGKNLFTDPLYVNFPSVQTFVNQVSGEQAGYGTYEYHEDTVSGKLVNKEAYWATVGIYGVQWRLVIVNVLSG